MTQREYQAQIKQMIGVLPAMSTLRATFAETLANNPQNLARAIYAHDPEAAALIYREIGKLLRKGADMTAAPDGKAVNE